MSLPFWEEKCWGKVLHCFANEQASVSYLEVNEGWQCSRHWHRERANTFVVISGRIVVDIFSDNPSITHPIKSNVLLASDSYTVASKVLHRFRVLESGRVIEVYFPDCEGGKVLLDDIVRLDVGGRIRDV